MSDRQLSFPQVTQLVRTLTEESCNSYVYSDNSDSDYGDIVDEDGDQEKPSASFPPPSSSNVISSTSLSLPSTKDIRLMDSDTLYAALQLVQTEVAELLAESPQVVFHMLRQYKFQRDLLTDAFMEDPDKTLALCGVISRVKEASNPALPLPPTSNTATTTFTTPTTTTTTTTPLCCPICFNDVEDEDVSPTAFFGLPGCPPSHIFCKPCFSLYIESKISDGPSCISSLTCPAAKCNQIITEEDVSLVSPSNLPSYRRYQLKSFVDLSSNLRWCSGPDCTYVASTRSGFGNATCPCGTSFCVRCGVEPHAPVDCSLLTLWDEKNKNESETANWIMVNTKQCPKCTKRIEKNQGCNHMTCSQCHHHFCWICMGDWSAHTDYYNCNRMDKDKSKKTDTSSAAVAKRDLERYLHYYQRYHAHEQAQKFAEKQLQETEARMLEVQGSENASWIDVQFLKDAVELIIACRRVLKFTYVFGFYLADGGKKNIFEDHQEMLEKFTEKLSELSEKKLDEMDRVAVINHTRVVETFMQNILKYVEDGMED
jgi:ariadne-1